MLAMARALLTQPKVLLLDEPSMGLSPLFVEKIFDTLKILKKAGKTILLVEQNVNLALDISDRAYVLETGKIVKEGKASDLKNDFSYKICLPRYLDTKKDPLRDLFLFDLVYFVSIFIIFVESFSSFYTYFFIIYFFL